MSGRKTAKSSGLNLFYEARQIFTASNSVFKFDAIHLNFFKRNHCLKPSCFFVKGERGLNYSLYCNCEAELKQNSSLWRSPFSLLWERKGFLLTKRRPFLSQALSNPTARERWRHCFASAKRRKFKFDIFKVRISVDKICKFSKIWDRYSRQNRRSLTLKF